MMKMFLSSLVILFSIIMFFINHPISMGLMILFQTLLTCLLLGMMINSYWFSYILFLVFLGGLLVLFIYVSSIASNEFLNFSFINKFFIFFSLIILLLFIYNNNNNNLTWLNLSFNEDMNNFFNLFFFSYNENNINLYKLYNNQTYFLMIMMIIYLFITLIAVVKITNIFFGPLRSFN
nr:NADH dehydrogenase subunit 6 [Neope muirheadii]